MRRDIYIYVLIKRNLTINSELFLKIKNNERTQCISASQGTPLEPVNAALGFSGRAIDTVSKAIDAASKLLVVRSHHSVNGLRREQKHPAHDKPQQKISRSPTDGIQFVLGLRRTA